MFQNPLFKLIINLIIRWAILAILTVLFYVIGWTNLGDFFYTNRFAALAMTVPILSMYIIEFSYCKIKGINLAKIHKIYLILAISIPLVIIVVFLFH
jgi:hypothetical protein